MNWKSHLPDGSGLAWRRMSSITASSMHSTHLPAPMWFFRRIVACVVVATGIAATACRPTPGTGTTTPSPAPRQPTPTIPPEPSRTLPSARPLPPIPMVDGPLAPRVVYPEANAVIPVRDSNFIFGSVGSGKATLTINGANVPVAPNETFLAFLPVPPPTAPRYELIARTSTNSAKLTVPVRVPAAREDLATSGRLVIDSSSVTPRGVTLGLRDLETVRVSVRAPVNATAWVVYEGGTQALANMGGTAFATDLHARDLRGSATLYVARGADTLHYALAKVAPVDTTGLATWVQLGDAAAAADTDAT